MFWHKEQESRYKPSNQLPQTKKNSILINFSIEKNDCSIYLSKTIKQRAAIKRKPSVSRRPYRILVHGALLPKTFMHGTNLVSLFIDYLLSDLDHVLLRADLNATKDTRMYWKHHFVTSYNQINASVLNYLKKSKFCPEKTYHIHNTRFRKKIILMICLDKIHDPQRLWFYSCFATNCLP